MPQTRTNCPRCHQPIVADISQLFDLNTDPDAKQHLLSGNFNLISCPNCGYQGNLATPIVYHDPDKELLLTYFPPELALPVNEQERLIGPLINQVVNRLPAEKRKGYLLRPQSMLTLQTLVERILEGDGITHEMIQAQQARLNLLQRLMSASQDARVDIAKEDESLLDENFFMLLSRLLETALNAGDENSGRQLGEIQKAVLPLSETGRRLQSQAKDAEQAVRALQDAAKGGLTREKLLDVFIKTPSEAALTTLVGMTRQGLDYTFFQILTQRIDQAKGEEQARLTKLRERLIEMTQAIDKELQAQAEQERKALEAILQAPDIEAAVANYLPGMSEMFVNLLNDELQAARQKGDLDRSAKLQKVAEVIQKASAPPPEYALIETLLSAPDDAARRKIMEEHSAEMTPEFMQLLTGLAAQMDGQDPEMAKQIQALNRLALRVTMEANLRK